MLMVTRGNNQCIEVTLEDGQKFYLGVRKHATDSGKFIIAFFADKKIKIDRTKKTIDSLWYEEKFGKEKENGTSEIGCENGVGKEG